MKKIVVKGVLQENVDFCNINFIYCWQQAINLWLLLNSYLKSWFLRKIGQSRALLPARKLVTCRVNLEEVNRISDHCCWIVFLLIFWQLNGVMSIHFMCWLAELFTNFLCNYFLERYLYLVVFGTVLQSAKQRKVECLQL